jgi:hypothetical protein
VRNICGANLRRAAAAEITILSATPMRQVLIWFPCPNAAGSPDLLARELTARAPDTMASNNDQFIMLDSNFKLLRDSYVAYAQEKSSIYFYTLCSGAAA